MPYCPIWSPMMLDLVDTNISRVSNAYGESHNKFYKERVLKNQKRNTIGDVCRPLREYNGYLIAEETLHGPKTKGNVKIYNPPIYPKTASNPFETEKWGQKKRFC